MRQIRLFTDTNELKVVTQTNRFLAEIKERVVSVSHSTASGNYSEDYPDSLSVWYTVVVEFIPLHAEESR